MKYRIEFDGLSQGFGATHYPEFFNAVAETRGKVGYRYFVDGKEVTIDEALEAASAAFDKARAKRLALQNTPKGE